jgi:hypothetical protein
MHHDDKDPNPDCCGAESPVTNSVYSYASDEMSQASRATEMKLGVLEM